MEQCCFMVLTMVMTVLTSTLHISHMQLIVVWWREGSKTSKVFVIKTMMLTMMLTMVMMIVLTMVLTM
eukprot:6277208-Ditylum_brightwellii.AAC.1